MGMWVILIGDSNNTISRYENIIFSGSKKIIKTAHQIDIFYENDYAQFLEDNRKLIIGDYEQTELEKIPFGNIKMIMLKYSDIDILKKIVSADDFPKDIIIDCDGVDLGLENIIDRKRLLNYELCE